MKEKGESNVPTRERSFSDLDPWRRWDPIRGMVNQFFGELTHDAGRVSNAPSVPRVDITETDDAYRIRAEVPGATKEDVAVEVHQGTLTIRGEKKSRRDEKSERGHRLECTYGSFVRSFALPDDADLDHVSAEFRDGVLEVVIRKGAEAKSRQIAVKG